MSRVRTAREGLRLTQAELAAQAGVSRQLVGAIEAGRHEPGVGAALAVAAALGTTVDALFGPDPTPCPPLFEGTIPAGSVRVGRAPAGVVIAAVEAFAALEGVSVEGRWDGAHLELFDGTSPATLVVAGCEPALALATSLVPTGAMVVTLSSGRAIEALRRGRVHVAAVHGPLDLLPTADPSWRRVRLSAWRVGVAVPRSVRSLQELLERRVPVVRRDDGAASQTAFERAAARCGVAPRWAGEASGHLDAARRVAHVPALAAITSEPAALAVGADFLEAEDHVVELWTRDDLVDLPQVAALFNTVASADFQRRLGAVAGYDLSHCGEVVR